jgi:hypothetical protein
MTPRVQDVSPATSTRSARLQLDCDHDDLLQPRLHAQAKYYSQLYIFLRFQFILQICSTFFYLLFWSLPLDMLGGLPMPTRWSPDLRVQIFYLVPCSPPPRHVRGFGHANLWVARHVGFYFSYVCSSFNCLTLVMSIRWCCVVAKPES